MSLDTLSLSASMLPVPPTPADVAEALPAINATQIAAAVAPVIAPAEALLESFADWVVTFPVAATRRAYRHDLRRFLEFASTTYLVSAPDELTPGMLAAWVERLADMDGAERLAPATCRRRATVVRGALAWARRQGEAERAARVEREQQACIARLSAEIVAYHAALAALYAAMARSAPSVVACGCSYLMEGHEANCPLAQAAALLAAA